MPLTPQDESHLSRALALAQRAIGLASPNPTVGCVIASGKTVLGEGAHLYDNLDHAEIAALKQAAQLQTTQSQHALKGTGFSPSPSSKKQQGALAPKGLRGATAYVTLEPCSHQGRTGPCADALIAAGIARCIIATVDPNPLVSGNGIARLRAAGVEVLLAEGTLANQARHLNDAFAHFIQHHRPFVTLKAALSVDGKLAPPPSSRITQSPHWLTGPAARTGVQALRHANDAILTGIGTVLADNPALTDRTNLPRRRPLLRVILDTNLRTPTNSVIAAQVPAPANPVISTEGALSRRSGETPVFVPAATPDLLILCAENAPTDREQTLRNEGIDVLRLPTHNGHLDLNTALQALAGRNILSVLLEAGSAVNGSFLQADLVDKLVLYYAERELGLDAVPFAAGFASPYELQQRLTQTTRATFPNGNTEDVRITGYLHDPWDRIPNP